MSGLWRRLRRKPDWVVVRDAAGNKHRAETGSCNGGEGRYEDWIYLRMLEREWLRPVEANLYDSIPVDCIGLRREPSWCLCSGATFETRIERLFRETAEAVPGPVKDHLLESVIPSSAREWTGSTGWCF